MKAVVISAHLAASKERVQLQLLFSLLKYCRVFFSVFPCQFCFLVASAQIIDDFKDKLSNT